MTTISKTLLQIGAFAALSTGFGLAQTDDKLKMSIPFDFTVGNKVIPAGEYTIATDLGTAIVRIRDSRYQVQATVQSITGSKPAEPNHSKLVFRVHGGQHYLASTWSAVSGSAREFVKTPAEREAELAAGPTTYTVLVARK
jgi:hypothetical protein